eukprot:m.32541 g.32541  ORF g.32541 m.32541 type:complete len:112 (+) comp12159_c0_seq2:146-481(+)
MDDEEVLDQQAMQISTWFAFWPRPLRLAFLNGLLDRTAPCDLDSAQLMDQMEVTSLGGTDSNQQQELLQSYTWFRSWPDKTRNGLMDILETIDMQAVYDFYDRFAQAKWKP